jgi:hypothetical protein
MERGRRAPVVGICVPTGLVQPRRHRDLPDDASLFVANAAGKPPRSASRSASSFMIIASKGAAGVSGAGRDLAGGLRPPPDLVDGVGLIVGIDRSCQARVPASRATPSRPW